MSNPSKSLEELDGPWAGPPWDTDLIVRVNQLRKRPIGTLGAEDLRVLIGQEIGLPRLIPLALDVLEREPLAEGDFYPGDLLSAVVAAEVWIADHDELWERLLRVVSAALGDARIREPSFEPLYERLGRFATEQFID